MVSAEWFDVFDEQNAALNFIKERKRVHEDGDWHRTAQIWILNNKKELLCNLRSKEKDLFAGYWDLSIGGHVSAGSNYEDTALRELKEELGITVSLKELVFLSDERIDGADPEKNLIDREHARLFLYVTNNMPDHFQIQKEEIERIEFFSIQWLIEKIDSGGFKVVPVKPFYRRILDLLVLNPSF